MRDKEIIIALAMKALHSLARMQCATDVSVASVIADVYDYAVKNSRARELCYETKV